MTFEQRTEKRVVIKHCVSAGIFLNDILTFLDKTDILSMVSRAIMFEWHKGFRNGGTCIEEMKAREGRPKSITGKRIYRLNNCSVYE